MLTKQLTKKPIRVQKKALKEKVVLLNKVTSKSVLKHTKKNWDEWIQILNNLGAQNLTHKEIVALLAKKYKLSIWWQQIVTSSYEVHIGRKVEGRNSKGEYSTVATKSIAVSQKKLWNFLVSSEGQKIWLKPLSVLKINLKEQYEAEGGIFGEIRTMAAPARLRLTWQDSDWDYHTIIQINCVKRPNEKSMIAIQPEKIKDLRLKKQMLDHWKGVLSELKAKVELSTSL